MYLVKYLTKTNSDNTLAVGDGRELFEIIWILSNSEHVIAWKIVDRKPEDFGWSPYMRKVVDKFEVEHYAQVN